MKFRCNFSYKLSTLTMAQISFVVPDHVSFSTVYAAFQSIGLSNISLFFPPSTEAPVELISTDRETKKQDGLENLSDFETLVLAHCDAETLPSAAFCDAESSDFQPMDIETWDCESVDDTVQE